MQPTVETRPAAAGSMRGVSLPIAGGLGAAGLAAFLVLAGERILAGLAVGVAGGLLVLGVYRAEDARERLRFAASSAERAVDALVFGALAWELFPADARAGTAALVALSISFVADYVLVKANGLGFRLLASGLALPLRLLAVTVGLLAGEVEAGLWAAAGVATVSLLTRTRELGRQGEPR